MIYIDFSRPDNRYKFGNDIFKPWDVYASLFIVKTYNRELLIGPIRVIMNGK